MSATFAIVAAVAVVTLVALALLVLFEPALAYRVTAPDVPLDSDAFMRIASLSRK